MGYIVHTVAWFLPIMNEIITNINYSIITLSSHLVYKILKRSEHFIEAKDLTYLIVEKTNEESFIIGERANKVVKNPKSIYTI